jgi:hypothetical protein
MQIYMFRLLLEWGRLTDDRRDEIGYHGWGWSIKCMIRRAQRGRRCTPSWYL